MSRLLNNSTPAERERGCVFAETFENNQKVVENGGTLVGTPAIHNSFSGDGTEHILYPSNQRIETGGIVSVSAWVKPDSSWSATGYIIAQDDTGSRQFRILLETGRTLTVTAYQSDASGKSAPGSSALDLNTWYHVAAVADGSTVTAYVDGVATGAGTAYDGTLDTPPTNLSIGASGNGLFDFYGEIKDAKVFNKALTAQEVLDIYNNQTYDYRNQAVLDLPMGAEQHDPSNLSGTELIVNGDFTTDASGWTGFTGGTITRTTGTIDPTGEAQVTPRGVGQTITTVIGAKYKVTAKVYAPSSNTASNAGTIAATATPTVGDGTSSQVTAEDETQTLSFEFTASSTTSSVYLAVLDRDVAWGSAGDVAYFDDVTCELIESQTLDVSKNGNNGKFGDGSVSTHPTKNTTLGYNFAPATDQRINFGDISTYDFSASDTTFSMCGWVKATGGGDNRVLFSKYAFSGAKTNQRQWRFFLDDAVGTQSELRWIASEDGTGTDDNITVSAPALRMDRGIWYHIAICTDFNLASNQYSFYINGVQVQQNNKTVSTIHEGTGEVMIGAGDDGDQYLFDGDIMMPKIFDICLTPTQMADMYQNELKKLNNA